VVVVWLFAAASLRARGGSGSDTCKGLGGGALAAESELIVADDKVSNY
jgi:hypothetical protein